ncbi:DUF637 domain-containing protein, partial [Ralstonia pseudosolanacearum]
VPNPSNPGTANGRWQFNPVVVTTQSGGAVAWHFNTPLDGAAMSAPTASGSTAQYLSNSPATAVLGGVGPQTLINALPANLRPGSTPFYYDPQAENQRLDQAALAQTGRTSFINGLTYDSQTHLTVDDQQKLILYQNAVDYAKAHNVQLGQALTPGQLAALDKPMLWYVTQQVPDPNCLSGACPMVSALVPQVYLPQGYSGIEPGGSIVASKSLELLADNPIRNTGTLGSYGTLKTNTTIVNEQRAAEMTAAWQPIEDGWARTTGQQGQANSGFVFAANATDIAGQIRNINGVVAQLNADGTMSAAEAARVAAAVQAGMQAVTSTHTDTFVRSPDVMGEIFAGVVIAAIAVMTGGALGPALSGLVSGTFGATVTGGAVGSMTGSAIGQFAANDGINFGKLFTAGAVGALTAGIANGVTVGADGSLGAAVDWSQKVADNSLAGLAGAQSVPGTTMTQAAGSTASNLAQRVEAILVLSGANAAVNTVAYGGSFGRAFVSGLAANVAAAGAYAIGGALPGIGATGATPGSIAANIAMHGLLGCAAQSVINGNCAGGAAGAMTSAIVAPLLRDALYGDTQTAFPNADGSVIDAYRNPVFNMVAVALSSMAGGAVANALGASATAGAAAAQNEALNNATADHTRPWDIIAAVFNKLTGGTYLINGGKAFFNTGADVIEAGAKAVFAGMRDATAPPPPGTPDDLGGNGPGTAGGGAVQVTGGSPAVCWEPPVCQPGTPPVVGGGYRPGGGSSPVIASEGNAGSSGSVNSGAAAGAANTGNVSIEPGASPDPNELRAGQGLAGLGYDVAHQPTASSQGISNVRTADLSVRGVGQVDVYTPESGTSTNAIIRAIEKKADQATGVFVQADLSSADMASIAARTWGKPNAKSIQTLFFQRQDGTIVRFNRPVSGG